jgi:hypothetical protein
VAPRDGAFSAARVAAGRCAFSGCGTRSGRRTRRFHALRRRRARVLTRRGRFARHRHAAWPCVLPRRRRLPRRGRTRSSVLPRRRGIHLRCPIDRPLDASLRCRGLGRAVHRTRLARHGALNRRRALRTTVHRLDLLPRRVLPARRDGARRWCAFGRTARHRT